MATAVITSPFPDKVKISICVPKSLNGERVKVTKRTNPDVTWRELLKNCKLKINLDRQDLVITRVSECRRPSSLNESVKEFLTKNYTKPSGQLGFAVKMAKVGRKRGSTRKKRGSPAGKVLETITIDDDEEEEFTNIKVDATDAGITTPVLAAGPSMLEEELQNRQQPEESSPSGAKNRSPSGLDNLLGKPDSRPRNVKNERDDQKPRKRVKVESYGGSRSTVLNLKLDDIDYEDLRPVVKQNAKTFCNGLLLRARKEVQSLKEEKDQYGTQRWEKVVEKIPVCSYLLDKLFAKVKE